MKGLVERLNEPEVHYPANFDTPKRANAILSSLCQEAADEIERLQANIDRHMEVIAQGCKANEELQKELAALKAAPKVEPVGYFWQDDEGYYHEARDERFFAGHTPLYLNPQSDRDALDKLQFALENCRLLAARHRKEDGALLILGFCAEGGVVGSTTR